MAVPFGNGFGGEKALWLTLSLRSRFVFIVSINNIPFLFLAEYFRLALSKLQSCDLFDEFDK